MLNRTPADTAAFYISEAIAAAAFGIWAAAVIVLCTALAGA